MKIPESHKEFIAEKTPAVLSTINGTEVVSAFCQIQGNDEDIILIDICMEQIEHIQENEKISVMTIDPSNMDRWLCIQGTIKPKKETKVNINKIIKFPK